MPQGQKTDAQAAGCPQVGPKAELEMAGQAFTFVITSISTPAHVHVLLPFAGVGIESRWVRVVHATSGL